LEGEEMEAPKRVELPVDALAAGAPARVAGMSMSIPSATPDRARTRVDESFLVNIWGTFQRRIQLETSAPAGESFSPDHSRHVLSRAAKDAKTPSW